MRDTRNNFRIRSILVVSLVALLFIPSLSCNNGRKLAGKTIELPASSSKIKVSSLMQPGAEIPFYIPEESLETRGPRWFDEFSFGAKNNHAEMSTWCVANLARFEIPFPRNLDDLLDSGYWPFMPPEKILEEVNTIFTIMGWSGRGYNYWEVESGLIDHVNPEAWDYYRSLGEGEKLLYLRSDVLTLIRNMIPWDQVIELPGYSFPEERRLALQHYIEWMGPYNPAFWTNPYTGELMHRIHPDEPEEDWWGNFIVLESEHRVGVLLVYRGNLRLQFGEGRGLTEITPALRELVRRGYK